MKIWLRKGIAVMLSLIMVISVLTSATVIDASATGFTPRTTAPDSSNAYYYSANPFHQSGYGMPNCTCYAYGRAYELLGSRPSLSTGNAGKWWWYNKNNGIYAYGSTPKLGAIVCWDQYDQNQGHVAVVEAINGSQITISESHYGGTFFTTRTINADSSNYLTSYRFLGYIYIGDFDPNPPDQPIDNYVDIGTDFYACIEHQSTGMYLTNQNTNVAGETPNGTSNQIWKFVRQSNGAYSIQSALNGYYLDVYGPYDEDNTNVYTWYEYTGGNNQQCYIYYQYDAYYFRPAHSSSRRLDMSSTEDHNLSLWGAGEDWSPQEFNIIKIDVYGSLPVAIGNEFCAKIKNISTNKYLTAVGDNVEGTDANCEKQQVWFFYRLSDGSYKIKNYYDWRAMDVDNYGAAGAGTNVHVYNDCDSTAQRFYIYELCGSYYIKPVCTDMVLDMSQTTYNLEVWGAEFDWSPQKFDIEKIEQSDIGVHKYIDKIVPPTINSEGYTEHVCSICGDSYIDNYTILGDANSDGSINLLDAVMAQKAALSITTLDEQGIANADINGDGKITLFDAIAIQKLALSVN